MAAGVVTELGGALSHAAIVAREFGVPSVVNVAGVTRLLRTGDVVRVDGDHGTSNAFMDDRESLDRRARRRREHRGIVSSRATRAIEEGRVFIGREARETRRRGARGRRA